MNGQFGFAIAAALAVATIVIAGAPPAATAAPPAKADCSSFADVFDRVKCRHDAVADQMAYTADEAFADGTVMRGRAGPERAKHIGNARARGQQSKGRTTKAALKRQAKAEARGNRKAGHLVPLTAFDDVNDDGICDYEQGDTNAQCAAVELDQFGELQACNPEKKNKGKGKGNPRGSGKFDGLECDLAFDPDNAVNTDEAADMEQAAEQMEEAFDAVEDDMIEMNGHLDAINAETPVGFSSLRAAAANGCDIPVFGPAATTAARVLRISAVTVRGVASVQDSVFSQTVVAFGAGGNLRSSASFFDYAAAVVEVAYVIADEIATDQSNQVQAATSACVADVATQVGEVADQLAALQALMAAQHVQIQANDNANTAATQANDNANTAALQARLNEVEAELSRILNTPHGQRESFPAH